MNRLYYPQSTVTIAGTEPPQMQFTDYLNKVSRLIPAEVIAGYLTMSGLVTAIKDESLQHVFSWIVFAAGLILTPLYLNMVADPGKPKRNHLIVSTFAFLVWAYVTTGAALSATVGVNYDAAAASIVLILFSFISALIPLDK